MNIWTQKSIYLANQKNYLDLLYKVYPMSVNLRRELDNLDIEKITKYFKDEDSLNLLKILLKQEIFPIKDSYVAYLKRDALAIERNPNTVARLTGMLYEMGLTEIFNKTSVPKETNRQIGPLFKCWIDKKLIGCKVTSDYAEILNSNENIIYNSSDENMKNFAKEYLGYTRDKGLDFIAKFNNIYVIAEAKFLTDFGGHQNAQFEDALSTMHCDLDVTDKEVRQISILDGVLYIKSNNKMYKKITENLKEDDVVISSILLRDYLYSL